MFDDRRTTRTFLSAPPSVTSLVAAVLEPAVAVGLYLAVAAAFDEPILRADVVLCLFVVALTFPGRNRFGDRPLNAAVDISVSWLGVAAILGLVGYATSSLQFFDARVLLWWGLATPAVHWIAVYAGRNALRRLAQQPGERRSVAIIGAGALSVRMRRALDARGVDFVGYFDDRADERVHADARAQRLGPLARAAAYVHDHGVQEVYITLPLGSQPRIVGLLEQLQGTTTSVFFVPDVFGISIIQGRLQDLQGVPVVGLCETPFTGINRLVKRGSDLVLASLVLLLTAPLLLALAVGVRLSSPGPVIFRQRRNGRAGEPIEIYKFRSMRVGAEPDDAQASRDDPRVTPFGAFMRRRSLDELPQFVNVLQGRMSVVGPRPHAVAHNEQYRSLIKAYWVRHKVRPGITGWAQVNGLRGETDTLEKMQRRIEYDLEYLRNWSLMLDLQIVARTIKLVFWDRHAY